VYFYQIKYIDLQLLSLSLIDPSWFLERIWLRRKNFRIFFFRNLAESLAESNFEPTVKAKRNQTPLVSCSARNTQVKKFQPATVRDEKTDFGHKTCKYLKY